MMSNEVKMNNHDELMINLKMRISQLKKSETLKHMRGRHDQRTHAWNRGMGGGGSASGTTSRRAIALQSRNPNATLLAESPSNEGISFGTGNSSISSTTPTASGERLSKGSRQRILSDIKSAMSEGRKIKKELQDREDAHDAEWSYPRTQQKMAAGEEDVMIRRSAAVNKHLQESEALEERRKELSKIIATSIMVLAEDFSKKYPVSANDLMELKADIINREEIAKKLKKNATTDEEKEKYQKQIDELGEEYEKIRIEAINNLKTFQEELYSFYMDILQSLEHDTPFELKISSDDVMDKAFEDSTKNKIPGLSKQRRIDLITQTAKMFPDDGKTAPMIGLINRSRAGAISDPDGRLGIIYSDGLTSVEDYVHETLHIMQAMAPDVLSLTEDWANSRIQGESRVKLNSIPMYAHRKYRNDETGYIDSVDEPYTLKYDADGIDFRNFMEVLTMGFTHINKSHEWKDKELLQIAINSIMNLG